MNNSTAILIKDINKAKEDCIRKAFDGFLKCKELGGIKRINNFENELILEELKDIQISD